MIMKELLMAILFCSAIMQMIVEVWNASMPVKLLAAFVGTLLGILSAFTFGRVVDALRPRTLIGLVLATSWVAITIVVAVNLAHYLFSGKQ